MIAGRLPEPDRRLQGHRADPQRRPDRLLRDRHDGARQADVRRLAATTPSGCRRASPLKELDVPPELAGLPDVPGRRAHPGSDRARRRLPSIDAALEPDTATATSTSSPSPTAAARTPSPRPRRSTRRTSRSTATSGRPTRPWPGSGGLRGAADAGRPRRAGPKPIAPPGRRGSRDCGRGSPPTGVDAYFGVRREHMRYLTGFALGDGEEKVAGNSGQFLVGGEEVVVLADSRYTIQARARRRTPAIVEAYNDLPTRWPELVASVGARRVAVEAGLRVARALGAARGGGPGRRARPGRGLGRGGPRDQGAGRGRADRRRLRRRRSGARHAAAGDPGRA